MMSVRPVLSGLVSPAGTTLAPARHALIGMVHLGPILAAGRARVRALAAVEDAACRDAEVLAAAGFDALMIENFGDTPFFPEAVPAHTIAGMTRCILAVRRVSPLPVGVNVLRNDARSALAIAAAVDAEMVRVNVHAGVAATDQGLISGRAYETVRYRDALDVATGNLTRIWADIRVKHAAPIAPRGLAEEAEELHFRAAADALIVSGAKTGGQTDPTDLRAVRAAVPCPIVVGSGASPATLAALMPVCDALIVGTWIKVAGSTRAAVDPRRAAEFVETARALGAALASGIEA
jgi:membrane complex biogenesis BtpA family protein